MGLCQSISRKESVKMEGAKITFKKQETGIKVEVREIVYFFKNIVHEK